MLIIIIILITGKLILIEFPINWLIMKVTDFVIDFCRSHRTIVQHTDSVTYKRRTFSNPCCIVLCIIGVCVMEQCNNLTAVL